MKITYSLLLISFTSFIILSCGPSKQSTTGNISINEKEWSLLQIPNNQDKVGTVFALDNKGIYTPLGNLDISSINSPAAIAQRFTDRSFSLSGLFGFLKVPYLDSTSTLDASRAKTIKTALSVDSPELSRYNGDLLASFQKKKDEIISNINFLNQQKSKIFLVTQTLSSEQVKLEINKKGETNAKLGTILGKVVGLNVNVKFDNSDSSILSYKLPEKLIVFYKLNAINVNYQTTKGDSVKAQNLSIESGPVRIN